MKLMFENHNSYLFKKFSKPGDPEESMKVFESADNESYILDEDEEVRIIDVNDFNFESSSCSIKMKVEESKLEEIKEEEMKIEEERKEPEQKIIPKVIPSRHSCDEVIMVVDDTYFNIVPVVHLLQQRGFNSITAENGLIAVNLFKHMLSKPCGCSSRVPKLIIMDLQMPTMDGIEATKQIVQLLKDAGSSDLTNIVALTSFTN
jgi:CheY-like chemotaxis protein